MWRRALREWEPLNGSYCLFVADFFFLSPYRPPTWLVCLILTVRRDIRGWWIPSSLPKPTRQSRWPVRILSTQTVVPPRYMHLHYSMNCKKRQSDLDYNRFGCWQPHQTGALVFSKRFMLTKASFFMASTFALFFLQIPDADVSGCVAKHPHCSPRVTSFTHVYCLQQHFVQGKKSLVL